MAFVHGRPGPHPFHAALARAVGADFVFVDRLLPWHAGGAGRLRRYTSWVLNAVALPARRQRRLILSEGHHVVPVLMRRLRLLGADQRTAALLANEVLYFLYAGRYPPRTERALRTTLAAYDALVCVGSMLTDLARDLLGPACPPLYTIPSAVAEHRLEAFLRVTPAYERPALLFVGNGPDGWRGWYKGIDLLLAAFRRVVDARPDATLTVVGRWDADYLRGLVEAAGVPPASVHAPGPSETLAPYLAEASLYVHPARGEAWGITVVEAMRAGLEPVVSEWTGAREAVRRLDPDLVTPLDPDTIADAVLARWRLPLEE
ncbi:MAG: glycosyltransferase, partial [Gemmatimonadetes bacterium]